MNNKNCSNTTNKTCKRLTLMPVIAGFIILPLLCFGCFKLLTNLSPETLILYDELMMKTGAKKEDKTSSDYLVRQTRQQVQKQLLFTENEQRMELQLLADNTQMIYDHSSDQTKIVEQMNGIVCTMQEELYYILPDGREACFFDEGTLLIRNEDAKNPASYVSQATKGIVPMQIIRHMVADKGFYDYKNDLFFAENVKIDCFTALSHELTLSLIPKKKLMNGVADSVEFSLDGKKLNFKANKLKATLN